ncbi:MAG: glycosyltransferase family 4 protein [Thaumarchaeota archaeon]|nr:glycosyltransferase family 4 protein [Nitrososphaerota archaeon]
MISRVCRLVWDYPQGGRSTYGLQPVFVGLSEAQVRQGYDVHVVSPSNGSPPEEEVRGVRVHRVPPPFTLNSMRLVRRLAGAGPEWVVHAHATCGFALFTTKYFRSFPLVCHVHGTSRSHHTPLTLRGGTITRNQNSLSVDYHMFRERIFWSSADKVLTVSAASKGDVTGFYKIKESKVSVVYNGVDAKTFYPGTPTQLPDAIAHLRGKRTILYVGHFGLRKGITYLIRAMATIGKEVQDSHLLCVGGVPKWLGGVDYLKILKREADSAGVAGRVTFLDAVPNSELVDFYRASEVFALPSYYETFSKVAIEAMACGIPVVATDGGGLREVVDNNETGILVRFGSASQLAGAILSLLQDTKTARRMGRLGRAKVETKFTWDSVATRVTDAYRELSR